MQCSTCRAQLPTGAAYCPSCGSITPFNVSSSGVSPSDTTVASFPYGESSPNPYTPNPYTTPPPPPPPPPDRRGGLSAGRIVLLLVLLLLIVGAGGILYFRTAPPASQPQAHASPTTPAQQVTATPSSTPTQPTATPASAQTPQDLYDQITQRPPTLDTPLSANDTSNWTESTSADGKYSCAFSGGAYHAIAQPQNAYMLCLAQASNFGDLAYQVQMTIVKGEFGGMVFRVDSSQTKYYSFLIDSSGTYSLITSVDNTGTRDYVLHKGTSEFFKTGLNQVNLIAVIARGSSIYLYINQHYVISASDKSYRAGQIGLFGGNYTHAPADVMFSHVQIWHL
jgi:hypothetical protein